MKPALVLITAAGLSLGSVLPSATAFAADKEEVPIAQVPQPVRATIEREAQGARVTEVDRLTDDGRLFKAEIKGRDSKELVYVDGDGKLIGKHVEKK